MNELSSLQSENKRLTDAIMAIAIYPITLTMPPENMDAFNMQLIAQRALEGADECQSSISEAQPKPNGAG